MTFSGRDEHLEAFLNSLGDFMLSFKPKPSELQLCRLTNLQREDESAQEAVGLATKVAHMERQVNWHPDSCFNLLMHMVLKLVENRQNKQQDQEFNEPFTAGTKTSPAFLAGQGRPRRQGQKGLHQG